MQLTEKVIAGNTIAISHLESALKAALLKNDFGAELVRASATVARLQKKAQTNGYVEVNGTLVDVSGNKDITLGVGGDNLIEGGAPSASTSYHVYLSSAGNLRLSATARDSTGYRTGDATNRFMGRLHLNALKQLTAAQNIVGIHEGLKIFNATHSTTTRLSGAAAYYSLTSLADCVFLAGSDLWGIAHVRDMYYDVAAILEIEITAGASTNSAIFTTRQGQANFVSKNNLAADATLITETLYHYKGSDTLTIFQNDWACILLRFTP